MWLITTLIAAIISSLLWLFLQKKYQLGFLSLMLWGATIMIFVDHILGYERGEFLERETDGLIKNGILLGIVMLIPVFLIWSIMLLITKFKKKN